MNSSSSLNMLVRSSMVLLRVFQIDSIIFILIRLQGLKAPQFRRPELNFDLLWKGRTAILVQDLYSKQPRAVVS